MANLKWNRPDIAEDKIQRTRQLIDQAVPDCLIAGYEGIVESLILPDADDRHVRAAAIVGRVDVIVTYNESDFPDDMLDTYGLLAEHPDTFVSHLLDLQAGAVVSQMRKHRASLKAPPKSVENYLATLEQLGLVQTVLAVEQYRDLL